MFRMLDVRADRNGCPTRFGTPHMDRMTGSTDTALMDRLRRMLAARVTGHVSWWVFVVARLMSELGLTMGGGLPRRYADYGEGSIFGTGRGHGDFGWTAYEPLTDRPPSG